ncbi:hypothetical protein GJAV_G00101820 [Gymnothorax javanicus]|nr:hypothetical protein GJAV_G00101820 [Gymnothorax javanicus]
MNPEPSSLLSQESDQQPAMEGERNSEEVKKGSVASPLPNGSEQPPKRGRGRPLGSVKKTPKLVKVPGKRGRPRKLVSDTTTPVKSPEMARKRGRPPKVIKMRGRPRKIPLTPEELEERMKSKGKPKGPRVWKPLGRPRIYPRQDPPPTTQQPRGRGRPRKAPSKQGAHLRKNPPPAREGPPRKRGRPAGSFKKNTVKKEAENNSEQKYSPPLAKRLRKSVGAADEPEEEKCQIKADEKCEANAEEDTGASQNEVSGSSEPSASGDQAENRDPTEDDEGSVPVVGQRKRGRPRVIEEQTATEEQGEACGKKGSGRKAAMPKKAAVGRKS